MAQIERFEHAHGIVLPEDYRSFLLSVSAGGAGPYYGLYTFEQALAEDGAGHRLDVPFPCENSVSPLVRDDEEYKSRTYGTLAICHEGCGYLVRLIVSGSARGQIWGDAAPTDGSLYPLAPSFSAWLQAWLDDVFTNS